MVARVFLPLVLVAGALIGLGVVYPTLNGPFRVDCSRVNETTCEQVWREAALHEEGLTSLLPVTRVRVIADYQAESAECLDIYLERWIFSRTVINDCL
ncbi:MAG TPA: hypothetical protein VJ839_07595 [Candidatus Limnocylindria bacterium]|nr:hypothetical protein [Candidatus Limnocylindria bacterium]